MVLAPTESRISVSWPKHSGLALAAAVLFTMAQAACGSSTPSNNTGGAGGSSTAAGGAGGGKTNATGGTAGSGDTSAKGGTSGTAGTSGTGTGGSTTGGTSGANDAAVVSVPDSAPAPLDTPGEAAAPVGAGPYGCTGCKRIFDGTTLDGWVTVPGAWTATDGVLASTGKESSIWTKADLGDYRIFFQVRQEKGDHQPCTTMFGNRPTGNQGRDLGGAQFQPPNGWSWNYGVGGTFTEINPKPGFDTKKWSQCEVLVKVSGSFRAACCQMGDPGAPACKTIQVLTWKGPGKKHPFCFMMHNGGLFDQYKEIWLEENPTVDDILSMK